MYSVSPMQGLENYFGDTVELIHCGDSEVDKARSLAGTVDAVLIFAGCDATDEGEFLVPDANVDYSIMAHGYKNTGNPIKAWLFGKLVKSGQKHIEASDEEGKGVGGDRVKLGVRSSQVAMIKAIGRINPKTVVNLVAGSMIMTADWDEQVPAILYNWYAGMEGGNALARILFGDVNPSGKLPKYSYIPELNVRLSQLAKRLNTPTQPVILVDQATGFDWTKDTIADKVHPNQG